MSIQSFANIDTSRNSAWPRRRKIASCLAIQNSARKYPGDDFVSRIKQFHFTLLHGEINPSCQCRHISEQKQIWDIRRKRKYTVFQKGSPVYFLNICQKLTDF